MINLPQLTTGQWIVVAVMALAVMAFPFWYRLMRYRLLDRMRIRPRANGHKKADLYMANGAVRREWLRLTGIINPIIAGLSTLFLPQPWRGIVTTSAFVWFPLRLLFEIMMDLRTYHRSGQLLEAEDEATKEA